MGEETLSASEEPSVELYKDQKNKHNVKKYPYSYNLKELGYSSQYWERFDLFSFSKTFR